MRCFLNNRSEKVPFAKRGVYRKKDSVILKAENSSEPKKNIVKKSEDDFNFSEHQIKRAVELLKKNGYKVFKPVTQHVEI